MNVPQHPNCYAYQGVWPTLKEGVFIAAGARIIGQVTLGKHCGVWFNAVIRGDVQQITIGSQSNIQDGCVLHVDHGAKGALQVGACVTVGHAAILHACTIEDEVLIGMGATLLNEAIIEHHAMVAAGAVVTPRTRVPSGTLFGGIPARHIRALSTDEQQAITESAANYLKYAVQHAT